MRTLNRRLRKLEESFARKKNGNPRQVLVTVYGRAPVEPMQFCSFRHRRRTAPDGVEIGDLRPTPILSD